MFARRMVAGGLVALLAAGVLAACVDRAADSDESVTGDSAAAVAPAPAPSPPALTDGQIAQVALTANSADSAAGVVAKTRSTDANIKAFGQRMISDHGGANQQAMQVATAGNISPMGSDLNTQLQDDAQSNLQHLQGLSGAEFDRAYIDHEVQMHQQVLDALDQQLIPNAQNPQLKALLQQIRPTIESHLQQAKEIQGRIAGGAAVTPTTSTAL